MPTPVYETKARPAATPLAIGIAISLVGWPVLGAAVYTGLRRPNDLAPSAPLALLGWVLVIVGAVLVGLGVHRLVQHADRAAGVRFVRDARGRAVWTTAQPTESVPPEWAPEE